MKPAQIPVQATANRIDRMRQIPGSNPLQLALVDFAQRRRFRFRVDSEVHEELADVVKPGSLKDEAVEQIQVEVEGVRRVDPARPIVCGLLPERCRLHDVRSTVQIAQAETQGLASFAEDMAVRVDPVEVPVHEVGSSTFEFGGDSEERAGKVDIVRVQIRYDFASGFLESIVERIRCAIVFFGDPEADPVFVLTDDVECLVRRPSVDDDVFQVGVVLSQNRPDRVFDIRSLVVGCRDDTDSGPLGPTAWWLRDSVVFGPPPPGMGADGRTGVFFRQGHCLAVKNTTVPRNAERRRRMPV